MPNKITRSKLNKLQTLIDSVFKRIGIDVSFTQHFLNRVNDDRNNKQITMRELGILFAKEYKQWGKPIADMGHKSQAVLKDLASDINIPFILEWDPINKELDLIAKTVMRKPNFHTSDKEFTVETNTTNPEDMKVIVPGIGQYDIRTLQLNIAEMIKTMAIRTATLDPSDFRWADYQLKTNLIQTKLKALLDTYDKLARQTKYKKMYESTITISDVKKMYNKHLNEDNSKQTKRFLNAVLNYLDDQIVNDIINRHDIGFHAANTLQAFNFPGMTVTPLLDLYHDWKEFGSIPNSWIHQNQTEIAEAIKSIRK